MLGILNDRTADGKDVSWVWDADFEVLAPRVRRATCSGTRAAELALRLKYAGVPTERIVVAARARARARRGRRRGRGPARRAAHVHRDARAARAADAPRRHPGVVRDVTPEEALIAWHDVENGGYDIDLDALARARRRARGLRARARRRRRDRPGRAAPRGARLPGRRARHRGGAAARARAPRGRRSRCETGVGDARTLRLDRRFGLIIAPMQTVQLLGGAGRPRAFLRAAREHLLPGGAARVAPSRTRWRASTPARSSAPSTGLRRGRARCGSPAARSAIVDEGHRVALVREREAVEPDGTRTRRARRDPPRPPAARRRSTRRAPRRACSARGRCSSRRPTTTSPRTVVMLRA